MNVLFTIHHRLDPNLGAPGVTLKLGQQYKKMGHEVVYYSFDNLPNYLSEKTKSIFFPLFVAIHILNLHRQQTLDIVDASTRDAWIWALLFHGRDKNSPLLVTRSHGLEHSMHLQKLEEAKRGNLNLSWKYYLYHGGYKLWEVSTSLRCADLIFQLNRYDANYAIENLGVELEQNYIVANGIPDTFLNLPIESIPESENATIRIAQIGSYIERKGIYYSASALNKILTLYPYIQVSFLGTGCSEAEVYKDFESAVHDRIRVVSNYAHETLPSLLKKHQIKLFPTLSEGFGIALIEAMACGLTPVTTNTPGPSEIITDGHDGILIPPYNSQAIEQALTRLILDRPYLDQLRRNAHNTAQHYSWKQVAQRQIRICEKTVGERKSTHFS